MYKINNKYYIKANNNYVEVEFVYNKNDVTLKPTKNKIEVNNSIKYEDVSFQSLKKDLISSHNEKKVHISDVLEEDDKIVIEEPKHARKYSKYNNRY